MMKNTIITVRLWGEEVGRLMWDARRGNSSFAYNPDFLKRGLNVAPIILPVDGPAALRPVWGSKDRLLGWKTDAIGEYMAEGMKVSGVRIEPTENSNIHLRAQIDGRHYKYIFRNGTDIAETFLSSDEKAGSEEFLKELVEQYLIPKARRCS